ncbi:unnamed protein product [Cochlearia groenlandica]
MTGPGGGVASRYALKPASISTEDILVCVDVDSDSAAEMKTTMRTNGRALTRLDCVKEAIIIFIHNKLSMNPDHRFAFATLSKSAAWVKKEFTSDAESAVATVRGLSSTKFSGRADLTLLFQEAAREAVTSRAKNRILRVILVYFRSSVKPTHYWHMNKKLFTLDVMYLHSKTDRDTCPQDVFDSLNDIVDHVSEHEGYLFENSQGRAQPVFKCMSKLLSHPKQRCAQDDLPESPEKKAPAAKPAVSSDKSALNAKKEVKQPLEETYNTNKKRIHSPGKEKASDSDLRNYDENLVGSRIKVWWPMDSTYYKGVVESYDSAIKKHLVLYDDGDEEILNMRKHKWYFLKKSSEQHEEANKTGCDVEASTFPQKKKTTTSKEQSTSKQSKMDGPLKMRKKDDKVVPQTSQRLAEQVLSSCPSQLKKHPTEAAKSTSAILNKHSNVVNSTSEGEFNALKPEEVVTKEKEDCQGPKEATVKDIQKAVEISPPEQTCVPKKILNPEHSLISLAHDSSVNAAIALINENVHDVVSPPREKVAEADVKTHGKRTVEIVQPPVAEEEDPRESQTFMHKRARVEICSLDKAHGETEKKAVEGESSCRSNKSSVEPGDLQHQKLSQPCSVTQQLDKAKQSILDTIATARQFRSELEIKEQSIVDTIATVRQFRSELEIKEQSIVDTLSSLRHFRSEMKKKEDTLEASILEIDMLGEKILGINKILNP